MFDLKRIENSSMAARDSSTHDVRSLSLIWSCSYSLTGSLCHQPLSPVSDVDFVGQNCRPVLDGVSRYRTSDMPERALKSNKSITIASAKDWKARCYSFSNGNERISGGGLVRFHISPGRNSTLSKCGWVSEDE